MKKLLIMLLFTTILYSQEKQQENTVKITPLFSSDNQTTKKEEEKKDSEKEKTQKTTSKEKQKELDKHTDKVKTPKEKNNNKKENKPLFLKPKKIIARKKRTLPKWLNESGELKSKIMFWGNKSKFLYGYRDERYLSYDKGAYLTTDSFDLGTEYYKTGFEDYASSLKNLKAGFNVAFKKRNAFKPKTLKKIEDIPEKTVPKEESAINPESWLNIGFFAGIDAKWIGIDLGLTVSLNPYYEKEIELIDGSKEEGRGWMWGTDTNVYPNFYLRLGKEKRAHFVFNVLREDYDLKYGVINMYVSIPLNKYFILDIGGYLYQTDSLFTALTVKYNKLSAKFKIGSIVNYRDDEFTRVAIFDSVFSTLALSYEF